MSTHDYANASRFSSALKRIFEHVYSEDPFKTMREKAFDHFLELGIPERKQEAFQYVPLRLLYENQYRIARSNQDITKTLATHILPECRESHFVFVNGFFEPTLSNWSGLPEKLVVLPLLEAMRSYSTFLQSRWSRALREERDPFAALNLATHPAGLFLYVPPKLEIKQPMQAIFLEDGLDIYAAPRIQMFLASHSKIDWITTHLGTGWNNSGIDFVLEDSAHMRHTAMGLANKGWNTGSVNGVLKRGSRYDYLGGEMGLGIKRQNFRLSLQGESCQAQLQGLSMLMGHAQNHTHIVMEHIAPYTRSMQKFKALVKDAAQSSFEGKIFVQKEAVKTEAYQLNNNLILSEGAIANSKPNLEIFADDVKASHGATVSQLDDEHIFYLCSRALTVAQAKALLIKASCQEILDQIDNMSLRNMAVNHAQQLAFSSI